MNLFASQLANANQIAYSEERALNTSISISKLVLHPSEPVIVKAHSFFNPDQSRYILGEKNELPRHFIIYENGSIVARSKDIGQTLKRIPDSRSRHNTEATRIASAGDILIEEREKEHPTDRLVYDLTGYSLHRAPLLIRNNLSLQLKKGLSVGEIQNFLDLKGLKVIDKASHVDMISVEFSGETTDLETLRKLVSEMKQDDGLEVVQNFYLSEINKIARSLEQSEIVNYASASTFLSSTSASNRKTIIDSNKTQEIEQWWIDDLEARKLWSKVDDADDVVIGVFDSGFSKHEDIIYSKEVRSGDAGFHGNHVSGTACAIHENHIGIDGINPNCIVFPFVVPNAAFSPGDILHFGLLQTFSSLIEELSNNPVEIVAINVSLADNWSYNGMNPPDGGDASDRLENLTRQSKVYHSTFEKLKSFGVPIFISAGNDSTVLNKIDSRYASSLHFAAKDSWNNGDRIAVLVEAHDQNGDNLDLSNVGGHLSCPGADITSLWAGSEILEASAETEMIKASNFVPNEFGEEYKILDGTSSACAASYSLLSSLNNDKKYDEIIRCMTKPKIGNDKNSKRVKLTLSNQYLARSISCKD